ncbi:hypothetical protein Golob_019951 [Gossypium lobatum]|uniref:Uncharacterized protein n=1 Tax=Gossypium lobatum TaxID=34289 RepID=A0A7J8L8W9_9ROSI|nr:hypothetical protein [Gossypium lobatum]
MQIVKRIQFLKWEKKIANDEHAVKLIEVERRPTLCCCPKLYALKQFVLKLKSQWRKAMRLQRGSMQFSYDFHSYSLNFDDGFPREHVLPYCVYWVSCWSQLLSVVTPTEFPMT